MNNDEIRANLLKRSRASRNERFGKLISGACITIIIAVVVSIFYFVASKGLATFFENKVNLWKFLTGTIWNPSAKDAQGNPQVGALPMIVGSFSVTFLAAIIATPFAIGAAVFMTEISPRLGKKVLQPDRKSVV